MSLVVVAIDCFENKIVIELGVHKNKQTVGYYFLPPRNVQIFIQIFLVYKESPRTQLEHFKK